MPKAAVVLSGCGFLDGAEITEAVSVLIALSQRGIEYQCFAPDVSFDVVDHTKCEPSGEKRNVLTEAARIARGDIDALRHLKVEEFDTVIFPGGFGAAKHLCTFASEGPDCEVHKEARRVLEGFHSAGKPIGLACIAPALGAKVLGSKGITVTIGNDKGTADAIRKTGAAHTDCAVTSIVEDDANNIVSTPAYMYGDASPAQVFEGVSAMVESIASRLGVKH
jgi:enhancing lycopene biosynthesis protein 2